MKRVTMNDINGYLDGALDQERRTAIESAAEKDLEIRALLSQHRNHVEELHRLYDPVLEEPVPDRMIALLRRRL